MRHGVVNPDEIENASDSDEGVSQLVTVMLVVLFTLTNNNNTSYFAVCLVF